MAERRRTKASWKDVKSAIEGFDRPGLLGLIHDLYSASDDNQAFLHSRFRLGPDVLLPYKKAIDRWLWPDIFRNQESSVAKAKQAIASYGRAVGDPSGSAELMVFFCERAAGFCAEVGLADESYFDPLVRMFEGALETIALLPENDRSALLDRLDEVRTLSHDFGYGVGDDMDDLLEDHAKA
jgi:hypothetical protein